MCAASRVVAARISPRPRTAASSSHAAAAAAVLLLPAAAASLLPLQLAVRARKQWRYTTRSPDARALWGLLATGPRQQEGAHTGARRRQHRFVTLLISSVTNRPPRFSKYWWGGRCQAATERQHANARRPPHIVG
jgi:hypothetical protein